MFSGGVPPLQVLLRSFFWGGRATFSNLGKKALPAAFSDEEQVYLLLKAELKEGTRCTLCKKLETDCGHTYLKLTVIIINLNVCVFEWIYLLLQSFTWFSVLYSTHKHSKDCMNFNTQLFNLLWKLYLGIMDPIYLFLQSLFIKCSNSMNDQHLFVMKVHQYAIFQIIK